MAPPDYKNGHSAEVSIRLLLNGRSLPIAQLGPDFLILEQALEHPPSHAAISLVIDGHEDRLPVWLPQGLSVDKVEVRLSKI